MFTSGLQHVAAMYAGVVAPPVIVGPAVGLSAKETAFLMGASLFTAGIATLLQTLGFWKVGARLPFVNGVSFSGVTPMRLRWSPRPALRRSRSTDPGRT